MPGINQCRFLEAMAAHGGVYSATVGWVWGSRSYSRTMIDSLVRRRYVAPVPEREHTWTLTTSGWRSCGVLQP